MHGNLRARGSGGPWVLTLHGTSLGRLELSEAPHNLAWVDADGRILYINALTSV